MPLYERALTIRERVLGPEHQATVRSRRQLATLSSLMAQRPSSEP